MIIELKVIPGAKKNLFLQEDGRIKVYLTARPVDGKANAALIGFLADHYGVPSSRVEIIKGLKSRNKAINIKNIIN